MAWLVLVVLAAAAFAALWKWGNLPRAGLELTGAALCVAVAGYAWQGSPAQPASPVAPLAAMSELGPETAALEKAMTGGVGNEGQWLSFADTLNRLGQTRSAVTAIRSGLREHPKSADLWVGLGNALVTHADGLMTPAATFAFQHAARLSPEHPGPPFFYGLALAQQGKTGEAGDVWRGLLARTPEDAPWRTDLETRLASIGETPNVPLKPAPLP